MTEISMSEICHDPDFKYTLIALNRLITGFFPLNSANLYFRDSVGRAKPNGVRKGAKERREEREWMKRQQRLHIDVAVLFFSRLAISFPLFLVPLSFTFEL